MFSESPLPGIQMAVFLLRSHMAEGARVVSGVSFLSFMEGPPSWPHPLPKAHLFPASPLGVEFQHINSEAHKHSVHCNGRNFGWLWLAVSSARGFSPVEARKLQLLSMLVLAMTRASPVALHLVR